MHQADITTDDLYGTELMLRNELNCDLIHRVPAENHQSFSASVLKYGSNTIVLSQNEKNQEEHQTVYTAVGKSAQEIGNFVSKFFNDSGEIHLGSRKSGVPRHAYPEPEGIIFDLDGTLIDSEPNYYESDRMLLADYGVEFSEEMKKKYVGVGNSFMMEDLRRRYNLSDPMEVLLEKKNRYYMDIARRNTQAFPEMKKLVERLAAEGYRLAIASGSSPEVIEELTEIVGLRKYFELLVSSEEVPRGKPAPDIFLLTAEKLGIKSAEAIVLEDTQYGVEAAVRAGMRCVAIPTITDPLDANFIMADLLFADGMKDFSADAFFRWLEKY